MHTFKKIFVAVTVMTMLGVAAVPAPASAVTAAELQAQIDALLAQLTQLQSQLATVEGGSTTGTVTGIPSGFTFSSNLTVGSTGDDVKYLQILLNSDSATKLADSGAGSPGSETTFFGPITRSGVIKFQDKYASDVLTPVGLTAGTGFFGPSTRSKANSILGAAVVPPPPAPPTGDTGTTTPPATGTGLTVGLALDTPASATIADGSAYNSILKVNLTAGVDGAVNVTGLKVTRGGFIANSNISGVGLFDSAGKRHGNLVSSLSADSVATLSFAADPVNVPAGTTVPVWIKVNIAAAADSGTVSFSVASAAAVSTASGATVSGVFPISGNPMTVVNGANSLGAVTLDIRPVNTSGTNMNVDATSSQEITKFRIQETSSNEAVNIYALTLWNNGNAAEGDYQDVELVAQTGTVLATGQPSGKEIKFDLSAAPYALDKGQTRDFTVRAKIVGGATRTIQFVVYNDYDLDVRGATTNSGVLASAGTTDTAFPIGNTTTTYNQVTISSGTASLVRASDSPSDAVVAGATNVSLAKYLVRPSGENMELRQVSFGLDQDTSSVALTGTVYVKVNGAIVWSAAANTTNFPVAGTASTRTLTTYPTLTAGQDNTIEVEGSVSTSATSSDAYFVNDFDLILVKRVITNDLVDPGTSTVDGNTINVQAAALTVTTLATPVATSTVAGTNNFEFARVELNAQASGENIRVTKLVFTDTLGSGTDFSGVNNLALYNAADMSSALSTSNSTATNAATVTFNLINAIEVSRSATVTVVLKGNVISSTGTSHLYFITDSGDSTTEITATGKTTGNTLAEANLTVSGTGQIMTVTTGGTLTGSVMTGTNATPAVVQLVNVGTTGGTYLAIKLNAQFEAQKVTSLTLRAAGTALSQNDVVNIKLYEQIGSGTVASTPFATASQFSTCASNACSNTWTATDNLLSAAIQPGTPVTIYAKADIGGEGVSKLADDFYMKLDMTSGNDITARGVSTATAPSYAGGNLNNSGAVTRIVPFSVAVSAFEPTGSVTQTVAAGTRVGVFKVQNNGSAQITLTSATFTDNGTNTGSTERHTVYASSENQSDYTTNTLEANASDDGVNFGTLSATTTINGGAYRYITVSVTTLGGVTTGDTFNLSVAALGNMLYSVTEANLGYSGNQDTDLGDTISSLYVSGTPVLGTISVQ